MNIQFPLLTPEQIEVKVKQVTASGAIMLLYKTARTDMDLLDAVVGPTNWQKDYKEIKGNLYCGIGIRDTDTGEWIWKWDCGTESRADDEGNEKKGEASDAAKRAGFCVGIGRELYTAPFTFAPLKTKKNDRGRFELENRYARFHVADIEYENRKITRLRIDDDDGNTVFTFPKTYAKDEGKRKEAQYDDRIEQAENTPVEMIAPGQRMFILNNARPKEVETLTSKYGKSLERMTMAQAQQNIAILQKRMSRSATA